MAWTIVTMLVTALAVGVAAHGVANRRPHPLAMGAMIFPPFLFDSHPPGGRALLAAAVGALVLVLVYTSVPRNPKPR